MVARAGISYQVVYFTDTGFQLDKEYDPDWEKKLEKEDEDEDIEPPKKKGRKAAAVKKPKNADLDIELDEE